MRLFPHASDLRGASRLAIICLAAGLASGCSLDATRLASPPVPPEPVGRAGIPDYTAAVPSARVDRHALLPPPQSVDHLPLPQASQPTARPTFSGGSEVIDWSAAGGGRVRVAPGESTAVLARRFGTSESAIRAANGLTADAEPAPGQIVVIPSRSSFAPVSAKARSHVRDSSAQTAAPSGPQRRSGTSHLVAPGETLTSLGRLYGVPVRRIASANGLRPDARIRIGQKLEVPGVAAGKKTTIAENSRRSAPADPAEIAARPEPRPETKLEDAAPAARTGGAPPERIRQARGMASRDESVAPQPAVYGSSASAGEPEIAKPEPARLSSTTFRWPVRGRIISGFGEKSNGQKNDGINLAVPEGSPVKAAENGVVVYAGNELKGFGNLVLVRHEGDFVTAYAHTSEILVKRGDTVRRGQIIAKAGQTGNVSSPQLHFEIRKGARPVDPTEYLAGT